MVEGLTRGGAGRSEALSREESRRALYKPGVSPADLEEYERLSAQPDSMLEGDQAASKLERASRRAAPWPRRKRWPLWTSAAALVVIVGIGAGLGLTAGQGDSTRVSATSGPVRTQGAVESTRTRHVLARDDGSQSYAAGPVSVISVGKFAYTSASGDTLLGIASRFHVCISDVLGGYPLAAQGQQLTAGLPIVIELGPWPLHKDGTVDCIEDGSAS